jgi:hypothetical protein
MSNSLLGNKQVNRLKEITQESVNNVFLGKKFKFEDDRFADSQEFFYGLTKFIVVYDFYSNTHVRTIYYKNEIKDDAIIGETINEYSLSNNRLSIITSNDYFFKGVKNTIDNRDGTYPFIYEEHVFYYNRDTGNVNVRVFVMGSEEATPIHQLLKLTFPKQNTFGSDISYAFLDYNVIHTTFIAYSM